jgi:hypothetical protein
MTNVFKACSASTDGEQVAPVWNIGIAILNELKPRDVMEAMLITQMIGVNNIAMETLPLAMRANQTCEGKEINIRQATKLIRTFTQQMATLKNYRQKGQDKVTVEHVTVNDGGQAIVGSITQGERSDKQNDE